MIKKILSIFLLSLFALTVACTESPKTNSIVMNYDDFGPSAMSFQLIGYPWWQWQSEGDGNPDTHYNVQVVVYKDTSLQKIEAAYPVSEAEKKDYRYIEYDQAISYLNTNLNDLKDPEFADPKLQSLLTATKEKVARLAEGK